MKIPNCDFVETTEYGNYCCLKHCACAEEKCEILKYGLGKEDFALKKNVKFLNMVSGKKI